MTEQDKLDLCVGCHDNFYNGKNPYGVKNCWMLPDAKVVQRTSVGIRQKPPYRWKPRTTLSCHTAPMGQHWIAKDDPRIKEATPDA